MQQIKQNLEDFSTTQLQIFFQHISLGREHLKWLLSEQQLDSLFKWVELKEDHKKKIEATRLEYIGNMSLIINTILTSTFGAWMGLSSCIGCGLGSYKALTIISISAFFLSGFIGYMSSNKTKQQAIQSIENQRLLNFQLQILETLINQLNKKIQDQAQYLNSATFILTPIKTDENKPDFTFNTLDETTGWFDQLENALKSRLKEVEGHTAYDFYQKKIFQGCYVIKKALNKHTKFLENISSHNKKSDRQLKIRPALSFLKILTNPTYAKPKSHPNQNGKWTGQDIKDIFLGLIPTIWGGFASMFVFVGGIPNIARELGFAELSAALIDPTARVIEITLALLVTAYFGFSFLYSSKKQWQRERLMEHTSGEITALESRLLISRHKLSTLYTIKSSIQKIISIFSVIKLTDQVNEAS